MKRLLVFIMLLALAYPAPAGLYIYVNGQPATPGSEIYIMPSDLVVLSIVGDGLTDPPWDGLLLVEGPGQIDGHTMVYQGMDSYYMDYPWYCPPGEICLDEWLIMLKEIYPYFSDLSFMGFYDFIGPPPPLDGPLVTDIMFHCQGPGDVTLTLFNVDLSTVHSRVIIHQGPEPPGLQIHVDGQPVTPDSEIYIMPSDIVVLSIHGDGSIPPPLTAWLIVEGPGTIAGGTMVYPGDQSTFEEVTCYGFPCLDDGFGGLAVMEFAHSTTPMPPLSGMLVDDIELHCDGPGDVTVSLVDAIVWDLGIEIISTYATVVIHQGPEPLPDLFIPPDSPTFSPFELEPLSILNVSWLAQNNSSACPPQSCPETFGQARGPWVEAVLLSRDGYPDGDDILLCSLMFLGNLAPGESHTVHIQAHIPQDCPRGEYKVIVYADYLAGQTSGSVEETDETNNWAVCSETLTIGPHPVTFYVDNDAPGDPAPNDPNVSDPCEDGTADHPFDTIQEAINAAIDLDTVLVAPGTYSESINFLGKDITLTSTRPTNSITARNTTIDGSVRFRGTEGPNCTLTGFNINQSIIGFDSQVDPAGDNHTHATISHCILVDIATGCGGVIQACDGTISNCLIANISYTCLRPAPVPAIVLCRAAFKNCTFTNMNDGIWIAAGETCTFENCIIDRSPPIMVLDEATLNVSCCNLHGSPYISFTSAEVNWGHGNIDGDPCFADPDNGDYHLKSQAGRWNPTSETWVLDEVTSPCIDAGDPMSPIGFELFPNGGIINMGAYGGTTEASKSYFGKPPCEIIVAGDINGDCIVDFKDFSLMSLHWLENNNP